MRAVITGEKWDDGRAKVVSLIDYYPYGMDMPGRSYTAEAYRYGYQGSERDRNMQGGSGYTTFFRSLDPRLGRWLNPDPKKFPWQSPYCSMDCNPVALTDVLGDDPPKAKKSDGLIGNNNGRPDNNSAKNTSSNQANNVLQFNNLFTDLTIPIDFSTVAYEKTNVSIPSKSNFVLDKNTTNTSKEESSSNYDKTKIILSDISSGLGVGGSIWYEIDFYNKTKHLIYYPEFGLFWNKEVLLFGRPVLSKAPSVLGNASNIITGLIIFTDVYDISQMNPKDDKSIILKITDIQISMTSFTPGVGPIFSILSRPLQKARDIGAENFNKQGTPFQYYHVIGGLSP